MIEVMSAVFVASLFGSVHCIGMCGGFVGFYSAGTNSRWPHLAYNGGRLITYLGLGALGGSLGAAVNMASGGPWAAYSAGGLIIAWGLVLLARAGGLAWAKKTPDWLNRILSRVLTPLMGRPPVVRGLVLGAASTLLPCGWLYGFAVTAAGTGSVAYGVAVMFAFWLGTVPAMLGAGLGFQLVGRRLAPRLGVILPLLLVVVGLTTIVQRPLGSIHGPGAHGEVQQHDCH
ncbi:MAG: sulfite exporter TauE/SafE family protein [Myxococcota bacterium]